MITQKIYDISDQTALRLVLNRIDAAREYLASGETMPPTAKDGTILVIPADSWRMAHERLAEAGIVLANIIRHMGDFDR